MILEIYKDAFSYALKDGSTLLKLGVLSLFSFLIIPFIFLLGYEYRIIKTATEGMINGNETLPEFNNYTTMFKDGLKVLAVSIIYVLISVVIFLLLFFIGLTTNMESIIVLAFIALIILTIISLIFSALAVTHMAANNGSINAAFHIRELKDIMQSIGVLKLVGSYFGIFLISAVISFVVYCGCGYFRICCFLCLCRHCPCIHMGFVYYSGLSCSTCCMAIFKHIFMPFLWFDLQFKGITVG